MGFLNVELPVDGQPPYNLFEISKAIGEILEVLIALDEEAVEKWIREKYPNGIGI
jgi:hypothetical protein